MTNTEDNREQALAVLKQYASHIRLIGNELGIDTGPLVQAYGEQVHQKVLDAVRTLTPSGIYSQDNSFVRAFIRGMLKDEPDKGIDLQALAEAGVVNNVQLCQSALEAQVTAYCRNLNAEDRKAISTWLLSGAKGVEGVVPGQGLQTLSGDVLSDVKSTRDYAEAMMQQLAVDPTRPTQLDSARVAQAVRSGKQAMEVVLE